VFEWWVVGGGGGGRHRGGVGSGGGSGGRGHGRGRFLVVVVVVVAVLFSPHSFMHSSKNSKLFSFPSQLYSNDSHFKVVVSK
jgi:hypothetical protein